MNQFQRESPYGAVKKLQRLSKEAPISGAPTPAMNTPQRSQRQAVRGRRAAQVPPPAAPTPNASPPQPSYYAQIAAIYQELALQTNDPEVHEYAARAAQQAAAA